MKKTQKFVSLLAIVFILISSAATSYAASCPPHPGYYIKTGYEARGSAIGSHIVNGKTCTLYEVFDVYVYECTATGCFDGFYQSNYSHMYHSICR